MKTKYLPESNQILAKLIHRNIIISTRETIDRCNRLRANPQEPDFIADLTLKFTPLLYDTLKDLFPNTKFSVSGIFCHQKPLANFGRKINPEIGDILFVYIETDKSKNSRCNSLLFQAKISSDPNPTVAGKDSEQLYLYERWPKFCYARAGKLNGISIDVQPKTINDGAQILLIDNDPIFGTSGARGTFPMGCSVPSKQLRLYNDLATELVEFINFKSGRAFDEDRTSTNDEWSKMIWDLLSIAQDKASKRKNSGLKSFPRSVVKNFDGCCYCLGDAMKAYPDLVTEFKKWDGEYNERNEWIDENEGAISVIVIESNDNEEILLE